MGWNEVIGLTIGQYSIQEEIGRSAAARVYRAYDEKNDREVAIKLLPIDNETRAEFLKRFEREVAITRTLAHHNIVPVYNSGHTDDFVYLALRLVQGGTLRQRIASQKAAARHMPVQEVCQYMIQIARALQYAHQQRIIHRDIKPSNMLFDTEGSGDILLTGFGTAKIVGSQRLTSTGKITGTPEYMSPEYAQGYDIDPRADLYSLGCVLYEALAGRPPFVGAMSVSVLEQQVNHPPVDIRILNDEVPADLWDVLRACLAKRPEDRPRAAEQLARELQPFADGVRLSEKPVIPEPVIPEPVIPEPVIPEPVIPEPVIPEQEQPAVSEEPEEEPEQPEPPAQPEAPAPTAPTEPVPVEREAEPAPPSETEPPAPDEEIAEPVSDDVELADDENGSVSTTESPAPNEQAKGASKAKTSARDPDDDSPDLPPTQTYPIIRPNLVTTRPHHSTSWVGNPYAPQPTELAPTPPLAVWYPPPTPVPNDPSPDYLSTFISHAHADNAVCDSYYYAFIQRGVDCYYDRVNPQTGSSLVLALQNRIERAKALVVMVSRAMLESFWVGQEIDMFLSLMSKDRSRVLIPVKIERCEMPPHLDGRWWIDATKQPFDSVIEQLARRLKVGSDTASAGRANGRHGHNEIITHVVDLNGKGDYTTIEAAIDAARPGERILVRRGIYTGGLVIDKPLELIGDGRPGQVGVRASGVNVITSVAGEGSITNLTVIQSGPQKGYGGYGVDIAAGRITLTDCEIRSQSLSCVAIHNGADPILRNNRLHEGGHHGVEVFDKGRGVLEANEIYANTYAGVMVRDKGAPTLRGNLIYQNEHAAIHVREQGGGVFEGNDLRGNGRGPWDIARDCQGRVKRADNDE